VNSVIRTKLSSLPREPGVYFMKGARGQVLYVGKAKDLRSRVASYFVESKDHSPKTRSLVRDIHDFEIMLVKTEVDALLLERTLIKHHQPPFNILLRDDKEYPYVRIDFSADWPRMTIVRRRLDDSAEYFGPFSAAGSLRTSMDAIKQVFPLIRCSPWEFEHTKRVCNYYHMKMCLGPCVYPVEKSAYKAMLRDSMALLEGRNDDVVKALHAKMMAASEREQYELAASYRDQIVAIDVLSERQTVMVAPDIDGDVIGLAKSNDAIAIHVAMIRGGRLIGGDSFTFTTSVIDVPEDADERGGAGETLAHFLLQYYEGRHVPSRIIVDHALDDAEALAAAIAVAGSKAPDLRELKNLRAPWPDLAGIAQKNAQYAHDESVRGMDRRRSSLEALQTTLGLDSPPRRIECIDISNLHGTAIVASDVCFIDGHPDKKLYRSYNVETVQGAPDDYASIREVVKRRIERGIREGDLPDLLVIDGGRGQLESALTSLAEFPGLTLRIVSLAKSRVEKHRGKKTSAASGAGTPPSSRAPKHSLERVFRPGNDTPVPLVPGSPAYRLLTQLRDEAHRFAITKHRKKRSKIGQKSLLEEVEGVGTKIREALLKHFGSIEAVAGANIDALILVKGVTREVAARIRRKLANGPA
jgi:excinuclease ABC subunit C